MKTNKEKQFNRQILATQTIRVALTDSTVWIKMKEKMVIDTSLQ